MRIAFSFSIISISNGIQKRKALDFSRLKLIQTKAELLIKVGIEKGGKKGKKNIHAHFNIICISIRVGFLAT